MRTYTPFRFTWESVEGETCSHVMRDYDLYIINPNDLLINGRATKVSIERIQLSDKNFYSGFLLEEGVAPVDLRANEGMCFPVASIEDSKKTIESYLHTLASDEEQVRIRAAKQREREARK